MPRLRYIVFFLLAAVLLFLGGCSVFRQTEQSHIYELQIKCPPGTATAVHNIPEILTT